MQWGASYSAGRRQGTSNYSHCSGLDAGAAGTSFFPEQAQHHSNVAQDSVLVAVVLHMPPKGWKPSRASAAPATAATVAGGPSPDGSWDPWSPCAGAAVGAWLRPLLAEGAGAAGGAACR